MTQYSMPEERTQVRFLLPLVEPTGKQLSSMSCSWDLCQTDSVSLCILQYRHSAHIIRTAAVIQKSRQPEVSIGSCLLKACLSRSSLQIASGHTVLAWSFLHASNIS